MILIYVNAFVESILELFGDYNSVANNYTSIVGITRISVRISGGGTG